jgi:hypothetical protein
VAIRAEDAWKIVTLPDAAKLHAVDARIGVGRLIEMAGTLQRLFVNCEDLRQARQMLAANRSAVSLHEFEGVFGYQSASDFSSQVNAIMSESVMPTLSTDPKRRMPTPRRPRIRTTLRKQFETMGILGKSQSDIEKHKIVADFPVAIAHGLVAEFAIKNGVMSFTETLDFDVSESLLPKRFVEAQAKCLVLRTAHEKFGKGTKRHIVVAGADAANAAPSIDLLSTIGDLYAIESAHDMAGYFRSIQESATFA